MSDIQPQNLSSLAVGHDAPATSRLIVPTIDLLAVASTIITRKKRKKKLAKHLQDWTVQWRKFQALAKKGLWCTRCSWPC